MVTSTIFVKYILANYFPVVQEEDFAAIYFIDVLETIKDEPGELFSP